MNGGILLVESTCLMKEEKKIFNTYLLYVLTCSTTGYLVHLEIQHGKEGMAL